MTSYDEWACPLNRVIVGWAEDGSDREESIVDLCNATLHLVWTYDWSISAEDPISIISPDDFPAYAYVHAWKVKCENGHTLAQNGREAEDYAEPFNISLVMKTIGAIKATRNV